MPTHVVSALHLNLRSAPDPSRPNKVAVLAQGTELTKIATSPTPGWWQVEVNISGTTLRGFVNSTYLAPIGAAFPSSKMSGGKLPPADLGPKATATRASAGSRAYSIGESGKPGKVNSHPSGPVKGIVNIVDWLDVDNKAHDRWEANSYTYCNIYAYDVCTIAGCYLPRVWWTSKALSDLQAGKTVEAKYGSTVTEMAANYIFNWLEDHGTHFGWTRVFDVDTLQNAANAGKIGVICAQRTQMNRPGHIQIIVPENGSHKAKRSGSMVTQPLQSQAGRKNFSYGFLNSNWWQSNTFREFGFWTNALN